MNYNYSNISIKRVIQSFIKICGYKYVITDKEILEKYEKDETLNLCFQFDILIKPSSPSEISEILKICTKFKIPVTPRGGGSGVTGGALPVRGGIVLSLERLNKIIDINIIENYVVAESGVITSNLCKAVEEFNLYFPVKTTSFQSSFIGGNVAENSGSINSCKYGNTAHYVLNLEIVLPTGEIIWTGANVPKNVTGINLTQLFIGSEGILGIITKVVFRLIKKPQFETLLLVGFEKLEYACKAVVAVKQSNILPSQVELICSNAISITADYLGEELPLVSKNIQAHLLIGIEENNENLLNQSLEYIVNILNQYTDIDILVGNTFKEKQQLSKLRVSIGSAMTSFGKIYRDIDASIPVNYLYTYIKEVESISEKFNLSLACFGHALDGNLHTMLLLKRNNTDTSNRLKLAVEQIYKFVTSKEGAISGEHGIGFLQKDYIALQLSNESIGLMKKMKTLMDPNLILNPGKIF